MTKGGPSLNPHGRPKGFAGVARMIMAETRDGAELVEWALNIWRDVRLDIKERMAAFAWLSDRGLGKPLAIVAAQVETTTNSRDWSQVPLEERRQLLERIRGVPALEGRDHNPKVLEGSATVLPALVATALPSTDEE